MAEVTIDVEARFIDNVSGKANAASRSFENVETSARDAAKEVDKLGKKKVEPSVDANTTKATTKVSKIDRLLSKLGNKRTDAKLGVLDKATAVITKVMNKAKAFGGKTYGAIVKLRDSNVLSTLSKMSGQMRSFTGKAWSVAVRVKDLATAPLRGIKNMLFSIKSLVVAITAGLAAKQLVINPINTADAYSSAKIGFSTLLGESAGQQMMNDLDVFAKKTPFKTSGVISNAQKMMAMGWDPETIIEDMEVIGNAAAATGKLDQGLESIVRAMSQIKTKGRLSTEELNQLAEAGISAKAMLAEELGYGTGDEGIAAMTEDLEKGAIASNEAIEALLAGMKKYDGMMDSMANETAEGLMSQIQDVFEINVVRKWGQGLQDGAKRGLGTVVGLLDEAEEGMAKFGDMLYEIGEKASNWVADKFENAVERITNITDSFEFKEASLGEKIAMLWKGVIADPFKEWFNDLWTDEGNIEKATEFGKNFAENLTKGILGVLGLTDIFADTGEGAESKGSNIAQGFAKGFVDGFDVSAISDKIVDAIGNVWSALPTWAKFLIGGYAVGKAAGGIASFAGGITSFIGGVGSIIGSSGTMGAGNAIVGASGLLGLLGKTGVAGVGASGILGGMANTGYALMGGTSALSVGGGTAALVGGAGIAGGIAAGATTISGAYDLYKGFTADDKTERTANIQSGGYKLAGVGTGAAIGAAIGSVVPVIGTALGGLVGAGLGGIAGWFMGGKAAKDIRAAAYESEAMKSAIKDSEMSAEELDQIFAKAKWENAKKHFGDIKLSMAEIERLADQIVWGDDMGNFEKFSSAAKQAEASLQSMKTAAEQTDRWMWKASLGVKFNDDEIESIKASFDDYINSAKSFVENKHYEFTAAVSLLVDVETEDGKSIIDSGNAFYTDIQEKLGALGTELSNTLDTVLEDGVISTKDKVKIKIDGVEYELNEQEAVAKLQAKIAEITNMLANAEQQAEIELIKVKFGNGNLTYESFENFMAQMQTTIDERMAANDQAFTASVSSLNLQLEQGAISQEEYDKQLQTLIDGYKGSNAKLRAEIRNVELQIIGEAYGDVLGKDAVTDLNKALQYAIDNGLDPIEISDQKMAELLNIELEGNGETISNLKDMLSGVFTQLGLIPVEVDGELYFKPKGSNVEEVVDDTVPDTVDKNVDVNVSGDKKVDPIELLPDDFSIPESMDETISMNLTAFKNIENNVSVLSEEFGIERSKAETILWNLSGTKTITGKVSYLAEEFGINSSEAETILWKLSGQKSIMNTIGLGAGDFGILNSYTFKPTVNIKAQLGTVTPIRFSSHGLATEGSGYRGGIFGGESAMDAFARGGRTDNGGIVGGSTRFIRVNEESPEMIIPLSSQRRDRAIKLWMKTGEMLDVPGFARGGSTDGGAEEWANFKARNIGEAASGGGQIFHIDFGGFTFEIHVTGSDPESIAAAIREQAPEIAETIAGIMNDAIAAQYENTPTRGGAA